LFSTMSVTHQFFRMVRKSLPVKNQGIWNEVGRGFWVILLMPLG